jgi:hypothetical protein
VLQKYLGVVDTTDFWAGLQRILSEQGLVMWVSPNAAMAIEQGLMPRPGSAAAAAATAMPPAAPQPAALLADVEEVRVVPGWERPDLEPKVTMTEDEVGGMCARKSYR